jgi:tetratricopeptide (TPR) repeat protein
MGRGEKEKAGTLLNNWALVVRAQGQPLAAERLFRRAIQISSADGNAESVSPMLLTNFARTLMDLGRLAEAREHADRADAQARRAGDEGVLTTSLYLRNLIYLRLGDLTRAASILAELEPRVRRYPAGHYFFTVLTSQQALLAQARGDEHAARAAHDRAVALSDEQDLPTMLLRRSAFALESHRLDQAAFDASRALTLVQQDGEPGTRSSRIGLAYLGVGRALQAQGKLADARSAFASAVENLEPSLGADHPDTRLARQFAAARGATR